MKTKIISVIVIFVCLISFVGCSCNKKSKYKGIDKIMSYEVPKGYKKEKNPVFNDDGELISVFYGDKKTSVYFIILSYDGKAVMGSDETFKEWYETTDNIVEKFYIKNADSYAYIFPIGITKDPTKEVDKSVIEAVFSYDGYLIMVGMFNHEGELITQSQKKTFSNVLKSINLKNN